MKLLIISNTAHYYNEDGVIVGHGSTVREINYLATIFDEIYNIACLYPGNAPLSALPYTCDRIHLVPVPPAGGVTFKAKLEVMRLLPLYIYTIMKHLLKADVVHVRAPANIPFFGIILLTLLPFPKKRWIKFGGSWQVTDATSTLSKIQQRWLSTGITRSKISVNGQWPDQPDYVHSFMNPSLTQNEIDEGRQMAENKQLSHPVRLIFVGNLAAQKGVDRALRIAAQLRIIGIDIMFDIIGDGPDRAKLEMLARDLSIAEYVTFYGEMPRPAIGEFYARAHIALFPSDTEGWPKVLSEAMAYGVVPVSSDVGSIGQFLGQFQTGKVFERNDIEGFVNAIQWYSKHPDQWRLESENSMRAASKFSYDLYLSSVKDMLEIN